MVELLHSVIGFVLVCLLIVMVFWTVQVIFGPKKSKKDKEKEKRSKQVVTKPIDVDVNQITSEKRAPKAETKKVRPERKPADKKTKEAAGEEVKTRKPARVNKDDKPRYYWYNNNAVAMVKKGEKASDHYHYFSGPRAVTRALIMEMYDCAIVRTDLLERIAQTQMEIAMAAMENSNDSFDLDDDLDVEFFDLDEELEMAVPDDMMDDAGNSSVEDYEMVIQAAIYEQWCVFVDALDEEVTIVAPDEIQRSIKRRLKEYGHNDLEVLLKGPQ